MHARFSVWADEHWLVVPAVLLLAFAVGGMYYFLGQRIVEALLVLALGVSYFLLMRNLTDRITYHVHENGLSIRRFGKELHIPFAAITHVEELAVSSLDKPLENWGIPGAHLLGHGVLVHTREKGVLVHPLAKKQFVATLQDHAQQFSGRIVDYVHRGSSA